MKQTSKDVSARFARCYKELSYLELVSTKKEYAESVGLSHSGNLNRIEDGRSEPSLTNILNLHSKYGVSLDWLFLGVGDVLE